MTIGLSLAGACSCGWCDTIPSGLPGVNGFLRFDGADRGAERSFLTVSWSAPYHPPAQIFGNLGEYHPPRSGQRATHGLATKSSGIRCGGRRCPPFLRRGRASLPLLPSPQPPPPPPPDPPARPPR